MEDEDGFFVENIFTQWAISLSSVRWRGGEGDNKPCYVEGLNKDSQSLIKTQAGSLSKRDCLDNISYRNIDLNNTTLQAIMTDCRHSDVTSFRYSSNNEATSGSRSCNLIFLKK